MKKGEFKSHSPRRTFPLGDEAWRKLQLLALYRNKTIEEWLTDLLSGLPDLELKEDHDDREENETRGAQADARPVVPGEGGPGDGQSLLGERS